jgi:hypothetical protein
LVEEEQVKEILDDLDEELRQLKRKREYSPELEEGVRKCIEWLHVMVERGIALTSLKKDDLPERMPRDWYEEYDHDADVFDDLQRCIKECQRVVDNAFEEFLSFEVTKEETKEG